ncbi:MAG: hypothetical protein DWQ10_15190 [Calditrichaeota bacterium]|nr:MAG: hypothetical protein DWQ10_15190 [Calditrichota bacterium]
MIHFFLPPIHRPADRFNPGSETCNGGAQIYCKSKKPVFLPKFLFRRLVDKFIEPQATKMRRRLCHILQDSMRYFFALQIKRILP